MSYIIEIATNDYTRAFDRCRDPFKGLEDIIASGCSRILTSAQKLKAIEGTDLIKQLIEAAKGRIIIMSGSGVRKENVKELAEKTGATEFHSSLKSLSKSKMEFIHPTFAASEEDHFMPVVEPEKLRI